MASITRSLSARMTPTGLSEIMLRVSVSREGRARLRSGIYIPADRMRAGKIIHPRVHHQTLTPLLRDVERQLLAMEERIYEACTRPDAGRMSSAELRAMLEGVIAGAAAPLAADHPDTPAEVVDAYIAAHPLSEARQKGYRVIQHTMERYAEWRRRTGSPRYVLTFSMLTAKVVGELEDFATDEWQRSQAIADMYEGRALPSRRSHNYIAGLMRMLRALCRWCHETGITSANPFATYKIKAHEAYGTPIYLTLEERDTLADIDLSDVPHIAVQRDIFIFQCLTGCRVSDLRALRREDVEDGVLEYVPSKTSRHTLHTVRVPLAPRAQAIIERYADDRREALLPCITPQKYNKAIKVAARRAGLDRRVTVVDTATGVAHRPHLWEVVSSHMARRTFAGNLFDRTLDPSIVCAMTGHKSQSAAFARYRAIDDSIKGRAIDLIK